MSPVLICVCVCVRMNGLLSVLCRMRKEESEWKRAIQIHKDELDTEKGLAPPIYWGNGTYIYIREIQI